MSPFAGLAFHPLDGILQVGFVGGTGREPTCMESASEMRPCPRALHPPPASPPPPPLTIATQALPYSWTMFYVPMHFLTHEMLLFFTAIWTTNIHDNLHAKVLGYAGLGWVCSGGGRRQAAGGTAQHIMKCASIVGSCLLGWYRCRSPCSLTHPPQVAPIMGAGYHTIHHTLYNYNYGHYTTFMDRLFGTLITPEEHQAKRAANRKETAAQEAAAAAAAAAALKAR